MAEPYEVLSRVYDLEWGEFAPRFIPLIVKILRDSNPHGVRILDLACGTGILATELAMQGYRVVGVDRSRGMIERAREKSNGENPVFYLQDMEFFNVNGTFNLVTCVFDSINYLKSKEQLKNMFSRVFSVLEPGGCFLFDSATHRMFREFHRGKFSYNLDGLRFTQYLVYRPLRRIAETRFDFGNGLEEIHYQYPHGYAKLKRILAECGFTYIKKISYSYKKNYNISRKRLVCIARKPL